VSVAIVDASGTIVAVNKTWERFGKRNGLRVPDSALGLNYLNYCPTDEPNSRRFLTQLKALLAGRRDLVDLYLSMPLANGGAMVLPHRAAPLL
jgi:hypothetical protein